MSFSLHFTAKAIPFAGDGLDLVNLAALSFSSRAMCRLVAVETFSAGQVTDVHVADNSPPSVSSHQNTTTSFQLKARIQTRESQTNLKHVFARRPGGPAAENIPFRNFAVSLLSHSKPIIIPNLTFSSFRTRPLSNSHILEMLLSSSVPNFFVKQINFAWGIAFLFSGPFPERVAESYPDLRILNLSQCKGLTDITAIVKHCPNLVELSLGNTAMNFKVIGEDSASMIPLQHLRYLALDEYPFDTAACQYYQQPSVKIVKWMKSVCSTQSLRYLDLRRSFLTSMDWSGLEEFENLNQVDLSNQSDEHFTLICFQNSNNILVALSRCPKLMFLDLSHTSIGIINAWSNTMQHFMKSNRNDQGFCQLKCLNLASMDVERSSSGGLGGFFGTMTTDDAASSDAPSRSMKLRSLNLSNNNQHALSCHPKQEDEFSAIDHRHKTVDLVRFLNMHCKGSLMHLDLTNCSMPDSAFERRKFARSSILEEVADTLESLSLKGWRTRLDRLINEYLPTMHALVSLDLRLEEDQSGGTIINPRAAAAAQNQPDPDDLDCFKILAERAPRLHHLWIRTASMRADVELNHLRDFEYLTTLHYDQAGVQKQEEAVNTMNDDEDLKLFSAALAELAADGVRLVEY